MTKPFITKLLIALSFAILIPGTSVFAQDDEAIGRVISATGTVQARSGNGDMRTLARRSEIFVQDTIITGLDGFAQLRLIDTGMIAFKADTEFTFEEYHSDGAGGAPDNAIMSMVRGGFRTISGTIGDDDQDGYEVETPFASIGIRGTNYEALITEDTSNGDDNSTLLTGTYEGGNSVSNDEGTLNTGVGAGFNFSRTRRGGAPVGELDQPDELGLIDITPNADNDNDEDGAADGDGAAGDDGSASEDDGAVGEDDGGDDGAGNDEGGNDGATDNDGVGDGGDDGGPDLDGLGTDGSGDDGTGDTGALAAPAAGNPGADDSPTLNLDPSATAGNSPEAAVNPAGGVRDEGDLEVAGAVDEEAARLAAEEEVARLEAEEAARIAAEEELARIAAEAAEEAARIAAEEEAGRTEAEQEAARIAAEEEAARIAEEEEIARIAAEEEAIRIAEEEEAARIVAEEAALEEEAARIAAEEQAEVDRLAAEQAAIAATEAAAVERVVTAITNVQERLGFTLYNTSNPGALFSGNSSDASDGTTFWLLGNDLLSTTPRTIDETPPVLFEGTTNTVGGNYFFDGIHSANFSSNEITLDIQWGLWGNSGSSPISQFSQDDNYVEAEHPTDLLWFSVLPTPITDLSGSHHFATVSTTSFSSAFGSHVSSSNLGQIDNLFSTFDVDFTTGSISHGFMSFCLGGVGLCNQSSAQEWEFNYSGNVSEGFVIASPDANTGFINDEAVDITGSIQGVFTGSTPSVSPLAFVGGIALTSTPDSGSSLIAANVHSAFLVEHEHRISNAEILSLDFDSLLVQEKYARVLLGNSRSTSGGTVPIIFRDAQTSPNLVIREDNSLPVSVSLVETNIMNYGVGWERWEGSLFTYADNLDGGVFDSGASSDIAFFSTFNISRMPTITGRYNNVVSFIGEGDNGTPISALKMAFDVNFSLGLNNIDDGELIIDVGPDETWIVFFDGSINNNQANFNILTDNGFGQNSEVLLLSDNDNIDVGDSSMRGVFVDNGADQALLASFYFRDTPGGDFDNEAVSGLALVDQQLPEDLRLSPANLNVSNASLVNLGFVLPTDPDSTTGLFDPVLSNDSSLGNQFLVATDDDYPYNPESFGWIYSRDTASVEGLDTNVDGYGINWGFWGTPNQDPADGPVAYTDSLNPSVTESGFDSILWATVNAPVISNYTGSATYTNILFPGSFIAYSPFGTVQEVRVAFDVDFNASLSPVSNGYLGVCITSTDCDNGITWDVTFDGEVHDGYLTANNISGSRDDGVDIDPITNAVFTGVFTGNNTSADPYEAFLAGFNLTETNSGDSVTGAVIVEKEEFLSANQILAARESEDVRGLISLQDQGIAALEGTNSLSSNSYDVFFFDYYEGEESPDSIEVVNFKQTFAEHFQTYSESDPDYFLQMGHWKEDGSEIEDGFFSESNSNGDIPDSFSFPPPGSWINYSPTEFSQLTGRFNEVINQYGVYTANNGTQYEVDSLEVKFDVDFASGSISNSKLLVQVFDTGPSNDVDLWWKVTFDDIFDPSNQEFELILSNANYYEYADNGSLINQFPIDVGQSELLIDFTGDENTPIAVGAYDFYVANTDSWVTGTYAAEGFVEDRLSSSELQEMDSRIGLLALHGGARRAYIGGSTDSNSGSVKIGINFEGEGPLNFDDSYLLIPRFEEIYSAMSPAATTQTNVGGFDVDWSFWDKDEIFLQNSNINGSGEGNSPFDIIWASVQSADLADLTGTWNYVASSFLGEANDGALTALNMSFIANFATADISNGKFEANTAGETTWNFNFTGAISGAIAQMDSVFTNSIINGDGATIMGEINGVFTGSGSTQAFATAFSLEATNGASASIGTLHGVGLLNQTPDVRFDNSGIDSDGIFREDLTNLGFVLLSDPGNVPGSDFLYSVMASDSNSIAVADRPVFGQLNPTIDPIYPFTPSLDRVFINENNSNSSDIQFSNVGESQYQVNWGTWNSPGNSNNGLSAYTSATDVSSFENDFKALTWLTVANPRISSNMGTFNYARTLDVIGEGTKVGGDNRLVRSVVAYFDIDLSLATNNVTNGSIEVCASVATDCSGGDNWAATFNADLNGGILSSTSLTGSVNGQGFGGELTGVFTGFEAEDTTKPYDAFAGGFNFLDNSDNDNYVTGAFLLEREDRVSAYDLMEMDTRVGLIAQHGSDQNVLMGGSTDSNSGSPTIGINLEEVSPGVFQELAYDDPELLTPAYTEVYSDVTPITPITPDASFDVDWGAWNVGDALVQNDNLDPSSVSHTPTNELFWASAEPSNIADLTGEWLYSGSSHYLGSASDGAMDGFTMWFEVDFGNGGINSGNFEASTTGGTDWHLHFGGMVSGARAQMNNFTSTDINGISTSITGDINGVFTGTGATQGFVTGFSLQADSIGSLNGVGLLGRGAIPD